MATYTYDLDEYTRRVAGDLQQMIEPYMGMIVFKVISEVHGRLTEQTPVDTGYLRLSLTTAINGELLYVPEPKASRKAGAYIPQWDESTTAASKSFAEYTLGDVIEIGYTANYAPYVEDKVHMVENTMTDLRYIVSSAVGEVKAGLGA